MLRFSNLLPWKPQGCIWVVRYSVHFILVVGPEFPVTVISVMCRWAIGRIDTVLSLRVTLINISSIVINVRFSVWGVSRNIVTWGRLLLAFVVDTIADLLMGKIWHTSWICSRNVLFLWPSSTPGPVIKCLSSVIWFGSRCHAVILCAWLASVGWAIIEDLCAAASLGLREGESCLFSRSLGQQVGLGFQTSAALPAVVWGNVWPETTQMYVG